ncbi:cation:proton antiporter [Nonomuraea sp. NPDC050394]|uniref:cation:proton antiporter n=1 Tax=Nonomuraea sp. NPDC050394 TaxID=3364363 RepID=UPI0037877F3A
MTDILAGTCLLLGAALTFVAGIGLVRFPGTLARMHAGSKPQVPGILLILAGMWLREPTAATGGPLLIVGCAQIITVAVATYVVGRAAYLSG